MTQPLGMRVVVGFETGHDIGGGTVTQGHCLRKYDGISSATDSLELRSFPSNGGRDAAVRFSNPLSLPELMAELTLEPDEAQTPDSLSIRLNFRDELIAAFEAAAAKLRQAPRS